MKKYHIYGIGGALVDTEVRVSDEFLAHANIEKGIMTLVDESRQRKLLDALFKQDSKFSRECGGSVCNSIVAAAKLGAKTFFSGKVANDVDGDLFKKELIKSGVDFNTEIQEPGITGKCLVMVSSDAERTMNTFLGISADLSEKEIDRDALANSQWFYVEGYLVTNKAMKSVLQEEITFARNSNVKIAITLSDPFVVEIFSDALRDVIGIGVDLMFCNKEEATTFTNTDNIDSALECLKSFARTVVITDGSNGAMTFDGNVVAKSAGVETIAVDTNGAGDMFSGAFLYAIASGRDYSWAANLANDCAAKVVSQFSPRLGDADFADIKRKFDI